MKKIVAVLIGASAAVAVLATGTVQAQVIDLCNWYTCYVFGWLCC